MSLESIESAVDTLRSALDELAAALPAARKELDAGKKAESQLSEALRTLSDVSSQLETTSASLAQIEGALEDCIHSAREGAFAVDAAFRSEAVELFRNAFAKLASAGFHVQIPSVGDVLDSELHVPKGKAKSTFGSSHVADVISWGFSFPSGKTQLAEVLVGDGTLTEQPKTQPAEPPAPKAGIAMVLDDEPAPSSSKKKPSDSLFDKFAEAAERNKER